MDTTTPSGSAHGSGAPTSTLGTSRYVNISSMRSNGMARLPMLQTRLPATQSGSSVGSSESQSTDQLSRDVRDSSLVLSMSEDGSMRKYVNDLMKDLGIDQTESECGAILQPPPPAAPSSEADELYDASLSDPVLVPLGIFRRRHLGLLVSLICASLLTSCLKRGVLPMMRAELQMAAYQADAAEVLVMLPWSCMFVIGFISDCFSICGAHRKAYVVLGWALVMSSLFLLAIVSYAHAHDVANGGGASAAAFVNLAVFLLGLACFGGILTVVMAEIYFLAMSKREKISQRGEVVGMMLMVQFACETLGQVVANYVVFRITAIGVEPLFSLRQIVIFLSLMSMLPLLATVFLFQEDAELMRSRTVSENEYQVPLTGLAKARHHATVVWALLQRESMWTITRFLVLFVFFSEFVLRYAHLVLDEVCGVTIVVTSIGKIIAELLSFAAVFLWRMFLLNTSWKYYALASFLGVVWLPQLLYLLLVLYNVSRDMGLYILAGSTKAFLRGLTVALQVAMAVEIAPRGAEGATVGAIMSIATITRLLATTVSNALSYVFDTQEISARGLDVQLTLTEEVDVARDPTTIQLPELLEKRVLMALLVCYTAKLLTVGGVGFMPHQKQHLQWLHRFGKSTPRHAVWTIGILAGSLLVAATFNALVVTPRTSCLKAFGGDGCST